MKPPRAVHVLAKNSTDGLGLSPKAEHADERTTGDALAGLLARSVARRAQATAVRWVGDPGQLRPPARVPSAVDVRRASRNRGAAPVLARVTDKYKTHYNQASEQLAATRELIEAVLGAHKATFEHKGAREQLVKPLREQIDRFAETVEAWGKASTAEDEGPLVKRAAQEWAKAKELRAELLKTLGGGDDKKGQESVDKALKARQAVKAEEEDKKLRAAAAKLQKEADANKLALLSDIYAPSANGGPAYARPPDDEIPTFREYVRLRHPAFDGLSAEQLKNDACPLYLLSSDQLARVESFVGRMSLSDWTRQRTPETRQAALGFDVWMVPKHASTLKFELGGEIFADWVTARPGHGFSIADLLKIWSFVMNFAEGPFMRVTRVDSKKVYEYIPERRTETKIVTKNNDNVLITCYDVRPRR